MMSRVLVTNAQIRSGLAVIRSLGRKGIEVTAADCDRVSTGFFSKYCSKRLVYPDPAKDPEGYADAILCEIKTTKYDVVIPINDYTLIPLSKRKREIEKYSRFPFLGYENLKKGRDKGLTVLEAKKCGIKVPETVIAKDDEDVEYVKREFSFPVIVRPRESSGSRGLFKVEYPEELLPRYQLVTQKYGPSLIQEYIPWGGMTYDVTVIMNKDSVARAVFVSNRIRTYPVFAGPNVLGEGVDCPELKETAIKFLKFLNWYGPAQVEFRIDPRDNKPRLMEVNPRLWGSLYLGIISGIDFPYLLYQLAMNEDIEPVLEYKTGIRARWFLPGDILHIIFNPQRGKVIKQWIKDFFDKNTKMYIPSRDDPLPLVGRLLAMLVYSVNVSKMKYLLRLKEGKGS